MPPGIWGENFGVDPGESLSNWQFSAHVRKCSVIGFKFPDQLVSYGVPQAGDQVSSAGACESLRLAGNGRPACRNPPITAIRADMEPMPEV